MTSFRPVVAFFILGVAVVKNDFYQAISNCKEGYALRDDLSQQSTARSQLECGALCSIRNTTCVAFNMCPRSGDAGSDGVFQCELLTTSAGNNCSLLHSRPGCLYMEKRCVHGTMGRTSKTCVCRPGFAGGKCDRFYRDCAEGVRYGQEGYMRNQTIQPLGAPRPVLVSCNYDWSVTELLYRTVDSRCPRPTHFFRASWEELKESYGDCWCNCFIGLENMYQLLRQGRYHLKVFVRYDNFTKTTVRFFYDFKMADESSNYSVSYASSNVHGPLGGQADHGFRPGGQWSFCTWDRDCGGCAQSAGHPGWFDMGALPACVAVLGFDDAMQWPINGVVRHYDNMKMEVAP